MNHLIEKVENNDRAHDDRRRRAAQTIQQYWRKRNAAKAKYMNADKRWKDAAMHAKMKVRVTKGSHSRSNNQSTPKIVREAAERGENRSWDRWKRGVFLANRLQDGNLMVQESGIQPDNSETNQKHLETQHWLELVDG